MLQQVAGGVRLTGAGYLPPALVTATLHELGLADEWFGRGNPEIQTTPVLRFRQQMIDLRLLRRRKGLLLPSRLGTSLVDDPEALWNHLARCIVAEADEVRLRATSFLLLGVATRRYDSRNAYLTLVANGRRRFAPEAAAIEIDFARDLLARLDAFDRSGHTRNRWSAGTVMGAAFARKALGGPDPLQIPAPLSR